MEPTATVGAPTSRANDWPGLTQTRSEIRGPGFARYNTRSIQIRIHGIRSSDRLLDAALVLALTGALSGLAPYHGLCAMVKRLR